jgi:hypothetical protein
MRISGSGEIGGNWDWDWVVKHGIGWGDFSRKKYVCV